MLTAGLSVFVGIACGLRLSFLPFLLVMISALGALAIGQAFMEARSLLEILGQLALALIGLQAGYVGGIWIRTCRRRF